ncbi:U-scoloptoxin(19)-Sm1a [Schistocerca cancellata]|uniref:U-scoloptoxin(19)-Sm1a n=1 Tax=Schistocerca cancellata TaxID=274614 RepID=UPI002117BF66|nr:U-scoloptoxin(19)-Sm1a [Schistocerca cancellata]
MSAEATALLLLLAAAALFAGDYAAPLEADSAEATPRPASVATAATFHPEAACSRQGGLCVLAAECPPGSLHNTTGLCPQQQPQGVECCYGLSVQERRCSARGGVCRPKHKCGRQLWEERAEDCGPTDTCCILVS